MLTDADFPPLLRQAVRRDESGRFAVGWDAGDAAAYDSCRFTLSRVNADWQYEVAPAQLSAGELPLPELPDDIPFQPRLGAVNGSIDVSFLHCWAPDHLGGAAPLPFGRFPTPEEVADYAQMSNRLVWY